MTDANAKTENSFSPSDAEPILEGTRHWEEVEDTLVPVFEDFSNRMLGEFRLLRLLGRGGMAEVYLADQTSLSRKVALKILRPEFKTNGVFLKRFEREARAAASLSHPNIVQVYSVGEEEGLHFIAQEYVKGLNLREYIRRKGPPSVQIALHFMKQTALALEKAGSEGIVHRDIKPENILITNKGAIKVADFGLAQLTNPRVDQSAVELTQVGTTMGTPLYMSPEQVHGQKLDQRSDLYSFGVTCFHMLAGEPPFRGETAMSVAVQHLNAPPPKLRDRRPDLPPALCQIVRKLLAKDPTKRYPDAGTLLKDIRQLQTALKEDVDPGSLNLSGFDIEVEDMETPTLWQRMSAWSPTRKLAVYAGACLIIAGLSAGFGWWSRPVDPLKQPTSSTNDIRLKPTAKEQYQIALAADEEDAWQAVIDHSDQNQVYRQRAMEQLGLLHLRKLDLDRANAVFEQLGKTEGSPRDEEFHTKALVGRAVIANLKGDNEEARRLFKQYGERDPLEPQTALSDYAVELKQRLAPVP